MTGQAGLMFAHQLALALGEEDVDAMLDRMPSGRFARWQAFFALRPWGAEADDHRAGVIASTVANMAGQKLKKGKTLKAADFFPRREPPRKPTHEELIAKLHAAFGTKKVTA